MRLAVAQKLRSAAAVLLACLAASVAFAQINPSEKTDQRTSPGPPTQNVLVVNGSGQPVPTAPQGTTNVAGTVNIGNTPSVTVANTPSVNVANTPSVSLIGSPTVTLAPGGSTNVTNPPDSQNNPTPLAIVEAAQPYWDKCTINFSGGTNAYCGFQIIPFGKRLVIQEFDGAGTFEAGVKPIFVELQLDVTHYFPATYMGDSGLNSNFATHQEARLYLGPAQIPICYLFTSSASSTGIYNCQLSGFLVDVP